MPDSGPHVRALCTFPAESNRLWSDLKQSVGRLQTRWYGGLVVESGGAATVPGMGCATVAGEPSDCADRIQLHFMLYQLKTLDGYAIETRDKESLGKVRDFLLAEEKPDLHYIVVDIGSWLKSRKVVLSQTVFGTPDTEREIIPADVTRKQVEEGPTLDERAPVSRKHEDAVAEYYGWPAPYMVGGLGIEAPTFAGQAGGPVLTVRQKAGPDSAPAGRATDPSGRPVGDDDAVLRSWQEVTGYHISAADGEIGHVEDFLVDPESWIVRYLVVDTRNWLPGRKVLVSTDWLRSFSYDEQTAQVDLPREQIKAAPELDLGRPVDRAYETALYAHYDIPGYWGV